MKNDIKQKSMNQSKTKINSRVYKKIQFQNYGLGGVWSQVQILSSRQ